MEWIKAISFYRLMRKRTAHTRKLVGILANAKRMYIAVLQDTTLRASSLVQYMRWILDIQRGAHHDPQLSDLALRVVRECMTLVQPLGLHWTVLLAQNEQILPV